MRSLVVTDDVDDIVEEHHDGGGQRRGVLVVVVRQTVLLDLEPRVAGGHPGACLGEGPQMTDDEVAGVDMGRRNRDHGLTLDG